MDFPLKLAIMALIVFFVTGAIDCRISSEVTPLTSVSSFALSVVIMSGIYTLLHMVFT